MSQFEIFCLLMKMRRSDVYYKNGTGYFMVDDVLYSALNSYRVILLITYAKARDRIDWIKPINSSVSDSQLLDTIVMQVHAIDMNARGITFDKWGA